MTAESSSHPEASDARQNDWVEMPRPTVAPMALSLGIVLLAAGIVLGSAFLLVGVVVFHFALGLWISNLFIGRGHFQELFAEPGRRARPIKGTNGLVEQLRTGAPGYRMQLPQTVHPISAGARGGIVGGLVMPLPALIYSVASGHGLWYPVNLLAGMVVPGVDKLSLAALERFDVSLLLAGFVIHAAVSLSLGLMYGVLLPMLPAIPKPIAWGGLLMPLLWSAVSFISMGIVNPALEKGVEWPSFVACQFIFGMIAALVVLQARNRPVVTGILGGAVGGLLMPIPAILWGVLTDRGIWYPVNLLAAMADRSIGHHPLDELQQYHADWFVTAVAVHAFLSIGFGLLYGSALPKLPVIPGPMCWGSLLMPILWTGMSFGLMGIVNPVLQQRVDWPWFIVSQFIFGLVASMAVIRSETIPVPPAGTGPGTLHP